MEHKIVEYVFIACLCVIMIAGTIFLLTVGYTEVAKMIREHRGR